MSCFDCRVYGIQDWEGTTSTRKRLWYQSLRTLVGSRNWKIRSELRCTNIPIPGIFIVSIEIGCTTNLL